MIRGVSMQIQAPAFDQINQKVSPDDDMYIGHGDEHYFGVGEKALANILAALNTTNVDLRVKKILDLPSGYGRVLRWLKASFPEAEITACDTNNKAVNFT